MSVGDIVGIAGAVAAVASAVASARSAQVAAVSTRPWVSGRVTSASAHQATVTLDNSGPGTAIDVRTRVNESRWADSIASIAAGATAARNVDPPAGFVQTEENIWALRVEVEFSGLSGARWRLTRDDAFAAPRLQRVERFRFRRSR
jgi:hypothetical protein